MSEQRGWLGKFLVAIFLILIILASKGIVLIIFLIGVALVYLAMLLILLLKKIIKIKEEKNTKERFEQLVKEYHQLELDKSKISICRQMDISSKILKEFGSEGLGILHQSAKDIKNNQNQSVFENCVKRFINILNSKSFWIIAGIILLMFIMYRLGVEDRQPWTKEKEAIMGCNEWGGKVVRDINDKYIGCSINGRIDE